MSSNDNGLFNYETYRLLFLIAICMSSYVLMKYYVICMIILFMYRVIVCIRYRFLGDIETKDRAVFITGCDTGKSFYSISNWVLIKLYDKCPCSSILICTNITSLHFNSWRDLLFRMIWKQYNNLTLASGKDQEILFKTVMRLCRVTALNSYPRNRFHDLYRMVVFLVYCMNVYWLLSKKYKC